MSTILVTAIAGDIAQAVAQIVRETLPDWTLLGCDVHERHGGGLYVDRTFIAPRAGSASYDSWLGNLLRTERVDLCLPMSEAELQHLSRAGRPAFATKLVMPNARAIEIGTDKLATARHLEATGCPFPWTVAADDSSAASYPCIFKPRRGAGSKGVFVCASAEEARFFSIRYPDAVLQELLLPEDREVTCAIYRTRDGRVAVLQLLRKLTGGFTGWARVIDDAEVRKQCESLAASLELRGAINVQLRITDKGPRIFEINPRFSSTVLMRHRMGFRDVVWALQEATGVDVVLSGPATGVTAVRTQGAEVLPATAAAPSPRESFDTRKQTSC